MRDRIALAEEEQEILDCYPVMSELRPHIQPEEFLSRVKRLAEIANYQLVFVIYLKIKQIGFRRKYRKK